MSGNCSDTFDLVFIETISNKNWDIISILQSTVWIATWTDIMATIKREISMELKHRMICTYIISTRNLTETDREGIHWLASVKLQCFNLLTLQYSEEQQRMWELRYGWFRFLRCSNVNHKYCICKTIIRFSKSHSKHYTGCLNTRRTSSQLLN